MADTLSVSTQGERSRRSQKSKGARPTSGGRSRKALSSIGESAPHIRMERTEDEEAFELKKRFTDIEERRLREWENYQRSHRSTIHEMNPTVFMDVTIGDVPSERLVVELFEDVVPLTTENFRGLCTGTAMYDEETGVKLDYIESTVHRVDNRAEQQTGSILMGELSALSISTTGAPLKDENFRKRHTERGLLSMISRGPNTIGSSFSITLGPCPHLDFVQVVFGKVVEGFTTLEKIEKLETSRIGVPKLPVAVAFCGALTGEKPTGTYVSLEEWKPAATSSVGSENVSAENTPRGVEATAEDHQNAAADSNANENSEATETEQTDSAAAADNQAGENDDSIPVADAAGTAPPSDEDSSPERKENDTDAAAAAAASENGGDVNDNDAVTNDVPEEEEAAAESGSAVERSESLEPEISMPIPAPE